jgi:hypothetical protein
MFSWLMVFKVTQNVNAKKYKEGHRFYPMPIQTKVYYVYEILIVRGGLGFASSRFGMLMRNSPFSYLAEILSESTTFSGSVKVRLNDW